MPWISFVFLTGVVGGETLGFLTVENESREAVAGVLLEIRWEVSAEKSGKIKVTTDAKGMASVDVPLPSTLWITPRKKGFLNEHGYPGGVEHSFTKSTEDEICVLGMARGKRLVGRVVDAESGKPVVKAIVSPMIFTPPLFTADTSREIETDKEGRFEIDAIDPDLGFEVRHPSFLAFRNEFTKEAFKKEGKHGLRVSVKMKKGEDLFGRVLDGEGRGLSGAIVAADEKRTVTDERGNYRLLSVRPRGGEEIDFEVRLKGYLDVDDSIESVGDAPHLVTMTKFPIVKGRVLMPDGAAAEKYRVELSPGKRLQSWNYSSAEVDSKSGGFALPLQEKEDFHIRVWRSGSPVFTENYPLKAAEKPLVIQLSRPLTLAIPFKLPAGVNMAPKIQVHKVMGEGDVLIMNGSDGSTLNIKAEFEEGPSELRVRNLAPDTRYQSYLYGPGLTPMSLDFKTGKESLRLKEQSLLGLGGVKGQVRQLFDREKPWPLASGEIGFMPPRHDFRDAEWAQPIRFRSDGEGNFQVEGVPAGRVHVGFPYWASADILMSFGKDVEVRPGELVEVGEVYRKVE